MYWIIRIFECFLLNVQIKLYALYWIVKKNCNTLYWMLKNWSALYWLYAIHVVVCSLTYGIRTDFSVYMCVSASLIVNSRHMLKKKYIYNCSLNNVHDHCWSRTFAFSRFTGLTGVVCRWSLPGSVLLRCIRSSLHFFLYFLFLFSFNQLNYVWF